MSEATDIANVNHARQIEAFKQLCDKQAAEIAQLREFTEIKSRFPAIKQAANEALDEAQKTRPLFRNEPINWADLRCVEVEYVIGDGNEYYLATVEEAAPECNELRKFILQHLTERGFVDVEVVTEW